MQSTTVVSESPKDSRNDPASDMDYFEKRKKQLAVYLKACQEGSSFYTVISILDKEWKLSRLQKKNLLNCRNDQQRNLGMMIAYEGDNGACQAYLTFLKKLCDQGLDPEHVFSLLTQQDNLGHSLGNFIACRRNQATLQQYIDLLLYLEGRGISSRQLFNLISLADNFKNRFGHYVVRFQNRESIRSYLTLLTHFLENGISPQEMLDYLKYQNSSSYTISHSIAFSQDPESVHAYFDFVEALLAKCQYPKDMLPLLTLKTTDQWTLAHFIAYHQDADCVQHYLRLVDKLYERGVKCNKIDLFHVKNYYSFNAYDILAHLQSADNLYRLICENVFDGMRDKIILARQKERVLLYIMTLPDAEKKQALANALTPGHVLYEFFGIKRGLNKPNMESGSYAKVKRALARLDATSVATTKVQELTAPLATAYKLPAASFTIPTYEPPAYQVNACAAPMQSVHGLYPVQLSATNFLNPVLQQPAFPHFQPIYRDSMREKIINTVPFCGAATSINTCNMQDISRGFVETNLLSQAQTMPSVAQSLAQPALSSMTVPSMSASPFAMYTSRALPPVPTPAYENSFVMPDFPTIKNKEIRAVFEGTRQPAKRQLVMGS